MQFTKSLKLLKKINSVFEHISDEPENLSSLEEELLKSYVVQLYDSIITKDEVTTEVRASSTEPVLSVSTDPKTIEEKPEPITATEANGEQKNGSVTTSYEPTEEVREEESEIEATQDLLGALFIEIEQEQGNSHIGERLVSDLKKSMGLNDKLLYANTLFNGDQTQLLSTLEHLNSAEDVESVKARLNVLAEKNNWLNDEKRKTVSQFIRLVVRKFSTVS